MSEETDRMRGLLRELQLSQREAARKLQVDGREFRRMCAGTRPVPNVVMLALLQLANRCGTCGCKLNDPAVIHDTPYCRPNIEYKFEINH